MASERIIPFCELKLVLIVIEQFVNVAEKEIVLLVWEKIKTPISVSLGRLAGSVTACLEARQALVCQEVHVLVVTLVISLGE